MKKIITIEDIMAAFLGGIGYGVGYLIPEHLGYNTVICFIVCFALGMLVDEISEKLLFNKHVQDNNKNRYYVFAGVILVFILSFVLVDRIFEHSLWEDVAEELGYAIIPPVAGVCFSYCVRLIKRKLILKKYGSGDDGFITDQKAIENLKKLTGENKSYSDYAGTDPVAKAVSGSYIGKKDKNGIRFLGITYANAERWKKAVQVEASTNIYEAYYFGKTEVQPESSHNILTEVEQAEDCLNLNVWTSKLEPEANKPVFVYFHGGDGRYGGNAHPLYHLENIAKAVPDAVFVSVNYRFGVFGVIDFSSTEIEGIDEYKDSTALSLLDQVEALKWIRDNISAFGGDPQNITVAGDSAGGSDICLLSVMKEAKGLFKRAFIMCASSMDTPDNNEPASMLGKKLIEEYDVKKVSDLKNITLEQLKKFSSKYYDLIELPPRNGYYITKDVEDEYLKGTAADIEFIFGIAADELSAWEGMVAGEVSINEMVSEYFARIRNTIKPEDNDRLDAIIDKYKQPGLSDLEAKKAILADFHYKACLIHDCRMLVKGGSKVRCFFWDVKGDVEKLTANAVSMVTAVLGNMDTAEQMGYIHENHITEMLHVLMDKYLQGQPLELYNNEIRGVSKFEWVEFDADKWNILHIQQNNIQMTDSVFSESIRELENIVFDI